LRECSKFQIIQTGETIAKRAEQGGEAFRGLPRREPKRVWISPRSEKRGALLRQWLPQRAALFLEETSEKLLLQHR